MLYLSQLRIVFKSFCWVKGYAVLNIYWPRNGSYINNHVHQQQQQHQPNVCGEEGYVVEQRQDVRKTRTAPLNLYRQTPGKPHNASSRVAIITQIIVEHIKRLNKMRRSLK